MFTCKIGILGGSGAAAGAHVFSKLVEVAQTEYSCIQDADFPEVVLVSLPISDLDETGTFDAVKILPRVENSIRQLENSGCKLILIACNTLHVLYDKLQENSKAQIINIIAETSKTARLKEVKKATVLCSQYLSSQNIYTKDLKKHGIECTKLSVRQQTELTGLILQIMGNPHSREMQDNFDKIVTKTLESGAEKIIVGCTELSILADKSKLKKQIIDSVEVGCKTVLTKA